MGASGGDLGIISYRLVRHLLMKKCPFSYTINLI